MIFACFTFGFLLGCVVVRRVTVPVSTTAPVLKKRAGRSLAKTAGVLGKLDDWIENTTIRSGLPTDAATQLVAATAVAVLSGVAAGVGGLSLPVMVWIALAGFIAYWLVLYVLAFRRQKKFVEYFPTAIDMIARSVQAGESFEEALETASRTVAEPVAGELKRLAQELELGMRVSTSMDAFGRRNCLTEVKIFANTVSLHSEMGGRLAETLGRLAEVIRMRSDYLRKIRSATSLGRFAAIGIVLGGLFVLGYMLIVHPDYIKKLWESEWGLRLVYYGIASEILGLVWVATTLKQEY